MEHGPHLPVGGFASLLRNRPFLTLWIGQVVSQVADKIFFVLLIVLVREYQAPQYLESLIPFFGERVADASVMIANTLPAVFFGVVAGLFIDRWSKRHTLWVTNLGRGMLVLMLPALPKFLGYLLLIAFLESILTQFFAPAEQAAIPILVKRHNLMSANALFTTTMMGSLVVGFAIGQPLISWSKSWGGVHAGEFLVSGLYVLASLILALTPIHEYRKPQGERLAPWRDLQQGFTYLAKNRLLSGALIQLTVLYSVFAALMVLAIELAAQIGLKETQFGFLLAAAGIGLILGAGLLGQWGDRFKHWPLPLIGFLSMAVVLMAFSYIHQLWLGLGLSLCLGVGAAFVGVPMQTLIQVQTPPEMRGKVFGVQNNVVNISLSLPLAIAGLLADATELRWVLVGLGLTVSLIGVWAWRSAQSWGPLSG